MTELPRDAIDEAVRLTHLARGAVDDDEAAAYRDERDAILDDHGYAARVREEDGQATLVCYPADWLADDAVDPERIDDLDRAVERPLAGAGDPDDWAAIEAHNRGLAEAVGDRHGPVHGATAAAFADFMSNHYARRVETAGPRECREFLEEYLPRNAWPTDEQLAVAETSLELVFAAADAEPPRIADGAK
ncbi:MAG: rnhA operon protein [Halobacteriales archaeon]